MKKNWLEIFPFGLTFGAHLSRPLLIFKDEKKERVLPVWLSPMDAGITLHQNTVEMGYSSSPHSLTWKIIKPLDIYLEKCCFTDIRGHHQYVTLYFKGHPKLKKIECRAEEAVSFCLSNKTQFFCEDSYFEKSRTMETEMTNVVNDIKSKPFLAKHNQKYLN